MPDMLRAKSVGTTPVQNLQLQARRGKVPEEWAWRRTGSQRPTFESLMWRYVQVVVVQDQDPWVVTFREEAAVAVASAGLASASSKEEEGALFEVI